MSRRAERRRRARRTAALSRRGVLASYQAWAQRRTTWAGLTVVGVVVAAFILLLNPGSGGGGAAAIQPAAIVDTPAAGAGAPVGLEPGNIAPDFEYSTLDGARRRLSDYRGAPLVLNFWATWCTSCRAEMPAFADLLERHESEGLTLLAMNLGDGRAAAIDYLEDLGVLEAFDVGFDPLTEVGRYYQAFGLPLSVFISPEGTVAKWWLGELTLAAMEEFAAPILGKATAAPAVAEGGTKPAPLNPGAQYPDLGRRHLPAGESFTGYNSTPPTSGPHASTVAPWGALADPIPPETLVHNLEHGGVAILYRDLNDPMLPLLTRLAENYVAKGRLVLLSPFPGMPTAYALVAWTRLDAFDVFDADATLRIEAFVDRYERAFNPEGF